MKCNCQEIGEDGTYNHSGTTHILEWIKNPLQHDWIGRRFKACSNHLQNYLKTGFQKEVTSV